MKTTAYLTHTAPGRCRVKIPDKRHDIDYFKLVQAEISGIAGVTQVAANPVSASVLVLYNNQSFTLYDLQSQLQRSHYFELTQAPKPVPVWQDVSRYLESFDEKLKAGSAGYFDFRSVLFILLVILAVRQLQKGTDELVV